MEEEDPNSPWYEPSVDPELVPLMLAIWFAIIIALLKWVDTLCIST